METGNDNSKKKTGWLLLKIWFGVLVVSELFYCVIVGIIIMFFPKMFMDGSYSLVILFLYLFVILALAVGALTLFLNCLRRIRENAVARFLSFFLLPLLMVVVVRVPGFGWGDIIFLSPPIIAFLPCLTVGYIWFVRRLKRMNDNIGMNHPSNPIK